MKIERSKNAGRNILFGTFLKVYQIIIPFVMRTVMLYYLGEQYLGLSSLFTSVLQVLNLAELGVGSAMVYSMYRPIADNDSTTICALMKLYRLYYRVIGLIIAVAGLLLTPFIPKLISGSVPDNLSIYALYLLNLGATVLSYWLFAYKNSLLQAHQRTDIVSKVTLFTSTVLYGSQLFILIVLKNYYLYVIATLASQALTNIITAVVVDRMFPNYHPKGKLSKDVVRGINQRIKDLFTAKIGGVVVNSADNVVISAFLGLTQLAIYQNYYFILKSIIGFIALIFVACTAGIGNSIVVETKEKNYNDLKKFTFIIAWIAGFCCCCFLCIYQPFMKLWVGEKLMLNYSAVVCFVVYFFVYEINQLLNTYKDAAGIWHEDRFRPLVTAAVNLVLNLILVQIIGIYGVILCTVLSMVFVGMPWLLHNLFTVLFDKKQLWTYVKDLFQYVAVTIAVCCISYFICSCVQVEGIIEIVINLVVCIIVPNVIFLFIYRKKKEFTESVILVDKLTHSKFKLMKIFNCR